MYVYVLDPPPAGAVQLATKLDVVTVVAEADVGALCKVVKVPSVE